MKEDRVRLPLVEKAKVKAMREGHSEVVPGTVVPDYEREQVEWEAGLRDQPFQFVTPRMCESSDVINVPGRGEVKAVLKELRWLERNAGGFYRQRRIAGRNAWEYLKEAERRIKSATRKVRESWGDWDATRSSIGNEFLPLPPGPYTRQLYLYDYWKMVAQCFEAYNHNPIAHGIITIKTAFTVGQGIRLNCVDDEVQAFMDDWLKEFDLNSRLSTWCDMLGLNGELAIEPWKVRPGVLNFVNIDPPTIWEFITNPRNINQVYGVWLQYATPNQIRTEKFNGGTVPTMEYVVELLPPDRILHIKINVHENEKRGRSDLLPLLGWLRWLKDFYHNKVIRAVAEASFVFDLLVKGNKADVARVKNQYKTWPKAGSWFIRNEAQELKVMGFDGAAAGQRSAIGDELLNLICVGAGVPKEYLGLGDQSTRATAVVATDPFGKQIQIRRQKLEGLLKKMFALVVKEAKKGKHLSPDCDESVEISWDELAPDSTKDKLEILTSMESAGIISHRRMASMATQEMDLTDYDYDEEQSEIEEDRVKDMDRMMAFGPPAPGDEGSEQNPAPKGVKPPKPPLFPKKPEKPMSPGNKKAVKKAMRK